MTLRGASADHRLSEDVLTIQASGHDAPSDDPPVGDARLDVELLEQTARGIAIRAPAHHVRAVPDAAVARVVVRDLDDQHGLERDPLEIATGRPAARLGRPALTRLERTQPLEQLTLLLRGEAGGVADHVQGALLVVQPEHQRADRALRLAGAVAGDDAVERALAAHLLHALALARQVRRVEPLGDHALVLVQPALGLFGRAHLRAELDRGGRHERLEQRAALVERPLEQHLVVQREQVEGDDDRGRLGAHALDARGGRMDALLQRAERDAAVGVAHHDLAVEHVAARREVELGEVAVERLIVARAELDVVAVDERDHAEAVPLRLVREAPGSSGSPRDGRASIGATGGERGSVTGVQYPGLDVTARRRNRA